MKSAFAILAFIASTQSFAAPVEAVDCKREMIGAALAKEAKNATLDGLLSNTYEVTDFGYLDKKSDYGDYDYVVTVVSTSRVDQTSVTTTYGAKVISVKRCLVKTKLLAN
jgi:hypothetical protein